MQIGNVNQSKRPHLHLVLLKLALCFLRMRAWLRSTTNTLDNFNLRVEEPKFDVMIMLKDGYALWIYNFE